MKIHFVTNMFPPDHLAGAALYGDLALYFKKMGHDVRVTSTFSYYPRWKLNPEDHGRWKRDDIWNGIIVRRLKMYVPSKPTGLTRALSEFSFLLSLLLGGRFWRWKPDVVLTLLPMLSQCLAQRLDPSLVGVPCMIAVQDFAVEAALELGIFKIPLFRGFLLWFQRWVLRSAGTISTISPTMFEKLKVTIGDDRRLVLIPNWIHDSLQKNIDRQKKTGVVRKDRQIFYSGNLGIKQGLPEFMELFDSVCDSAPGWTLKLHGDGADFDRLKKTLTTVRRVQMGPVLDEDAYVHELLGTSACLIAQKAELGANFLPSKLLPALASGTPVLAVCDADSPLGMEVLAGGFGEVIAPGDAEALRETLNRWAKDERLMLAMSNRAIERSKRYHRDFLLSQYMDELKRLGRVT